MFRLPGSASHMTAFEERMLRDAVAQQEMIDEWTRAVPTFGGADVLAALGAVDGAAKMMEELRRPELAFAREMEDLMSGRTFAREAMEFATGQRFAKDAARMMLKRTSGTEAIRMAVEQLTHEASGTEDLRREIERHALGYTTFHDFARQSEALESFATAVRGASPALSVDVALRNALKVETPWIDAALPLRSFEAFAAVSEIGRAVSEMSSYAAASAAYLRSLTGSWAPADPVAFALSGAAERAAAFMDSGIDPRIFDLPTNAFPEIARATGLAPAEPIRVRTGSGERKSSVLIEASGSLSDDATIQVRSVERMFRRELRVRMPVHFGPNWIKQRVPAPLRKAWEERRDRKGRRRPTIDLLDFSYFGDLVQLIMQKGVWETAFVPTVSMSREEFQVCTNRLIEIRNVLNHAGELEVAEFIMCFSEVTQLRSAFGVPQDDGPEV